MEPHPPYAPPAAFLDEEAALDPLPDGVDLDSQTGQYDASWDLWPTLSPSDQAPVEPTSARGGTTASCGGSTPSWSRSGRCSTTRGC